MNLEDLGFSPTHAFYFAEAAHPAWVAARVVRVDRGRVQLLSAQGELVAAGRSPVPVVDGEPVPMLAVGDWCAVSDHAGLGRIETLLPRAGCIVRSLESGGQASQILAANVDVAFVVTGLDGDFSLRRIERYLVLARASGVRPVVLLNKADLGGDVAGRLDAAIRLAPGLQVHALSALADDAAACVVGELGPGQTAVFLGSSGAGKSTLINALLGTSQQRVAPVRSGDDTGRHTTTRRELFLLPGGRAVIDTPGIRAVGVVGDADGLDEVFADVAALAPLCRFQDCRHEGEPDCAVEAAVEQGALDGARLESYRRLRREGENATLRQDVYARRQEERRTIGHYRKWARESLRLKGRS